MNFPKLNRSIVLAVAAGASLLLLANTGLAIMSAQNAHALSYKGVKREFYLFNMDNTRINETKVGMPADMYSISTMTVTKGDNVTIHFYNVEANASDQHSFTILDKPYVKNVILAGGQNRTINFIANETGVFGYICSFHQPVMRGQLVVLAPTADQFNAQKSAAP
ncbi:MAG: cupredoxin domain-containing protein [Nitrososphaera sp.]